MTKPSGNACRKHPPAAHVFYIFLVFGRQAKTSLCYITCRVRKGSWRLLRIIVYGVVRFPLQQRIRLTGLTCRIAFLYEMAFLNSRRRVSPGLEGKKKCSALESLFFFFSRWRAKSMKINLNLIGKVKRKSEFKK